MWGTVPASGDNSSPQLSSALPKGSPAAAGRVTGNRRGSGRREGLEKAERGDRLSGEEQPYPGKLRKRGGWREREQSCRPGCPVSSGREEQWRERFMTQSRVHGRPSVPVGRAPAESRAGHEGRPGSGLGISLRDTVSTAAHCWSPRDSRAGYLCSCSYRTTSPEDCCPTAEKAPGRLGAAASQHSSRRDHSQRVPSLQRRAARHEQWAGAPDQRWGAARPVTSGGRGAGRGKRGPPG